MDSTLWTADRLSLENQIGEKQSVEKERQEMTQGVAKDSIDRQIEAVSQEL